MAISSELLTTIGPSHISSFDYGNTNNITMNNVGLTISSIWPVGTPLLFAFQFESYNENRGQMYINGDMFFDSFSTGNGAYRITAGWGVGYSVASERQEYVSKYVVHGVGNIGIKPSLNGLYFRLHGVA